MILSSGDLIKLIHATKAVSIWNREKGPVFWYIAGVPGPYYVNTETLIGAENAAQLLNKITSILAETRNPEQRAALLSEAVLEAYIHNPVYKDLVATLIAGAKAEFGIDGYDIISGGERRDWLFSIPFAKECGIRHAFLFKDLSLYCPDPIKQNERALHIADLINNAASYLDLWLPALEKAGLSCAGSLCVISRGSSGLKKLEERGLKTLALANINMDFFEKSCASGLIDQATLQEIAVHFDSPKSWAEHYLMGHETLFAISQTDAKSFERMRSFFSKDPWSLQTSYAAFFEAMQKAIAARKQAA